MKAEQLEEAANLVRRINAAKALLDEIPMNDLKVGFGGAMLTIQPRDENRAPIEAAVIEFIVQSLAKDKQQLSHLGVEETKESDITGFPEDTAPVDGSPV